VIEIIQCVFEAEHLLFVSKTFEQSARKIGDVSTRNLHQHIQLSATTQKKLH